jgi:hypothetical protein
MKRDRDEQKRSCMICDHPESRQINSALARGVQQQTLATRYRMSSRTVHRHLQFCLKGEHALVHPRVDSSFSFEQELHKLFRKSSRLVEAIERDLQDIDNPDLLDISPRGSEITITYNDWNDLNERGNPTKKKAVLNDLLQIIAGTRREVMAVKSDTVDIRKLFLEGMRTLIGHIDQMGKFYGHWKHEPQKDRDEELEKLRIMIQASADENGVTFDEEARIFFALPVAQTLRPDLKAKLISDLEQ